MWRKYLGKIAGAVWCRIMDDYGHVDEDTPSLAISVLEEFRQCGIGTVLMQQMLTALKQQGYPQVFSVGAEENYAARMYENSDLKLWEGKEGKNILWCTDCKEYFSLFCTFRGVPVLSVCQQYCCAEKIWKCKRKASERRRIPLVVNGEKFHEKT